MGESPGNQYALLIIESICLFATGLFAWMVNRRVNRLLRYLQKYLPAEQWRLMGAPDSVNESVNDLQQRWLRFIRSGAYTKCAVPGMAAEIDAFRSVANRGLVIPGASGQAILYLFWLLLDPVFP